MVLLIFFIMCKTLFIITNIILFLKIKKIIFFIQKKNILRRFLGQKLS